MTIPWPGGFDLLPYLDATALYTVVSIFAGSIVAGLAGFAFSAVSGALLLHFLPPSTVVPLLLACSVTTQLVSIARLWHSMEWRRCLPFLTGGAAGIPIGAELLRRVDPHIFAAGFGAFLCAYSAYMLLRPIRALAGGGPLADTAAGFAGGITGGAIAFPGAVPTIWCNLRGLPKEAQRGIVQPFILLMQLGTLGYFSRLGMLGAGLAMRYLWCIPAVIVGTWLGIRLFHRIDDAMFRRVVLVFLLVSGAVLAF